MYLLCPKWTWGVCLMAHTRRPWGTAPLKQLPPASPASILLGEPASAGSLPHGKDEMGPLCKGLHSPRCTCFVLPVGHAVRS